LFANLKDAVATHRSVQASLLPWKGLIETHGVAPAEGQKQPFRHVFGTEPSLVLVRPDGYAAFTGPENSFKALEQYLGAWFPVRTVKQEEAVYA
jgi:hypothetical protein